METYTEQVIGLVLGFSDMRGSYSRQGVSRASLPVRTLRQRVRLTLLCITPLICPDTDTKQYDGMLTADMSAELYAV